MYILLPYEDKVNILDRSLKINMQSNYCTNEDVMLNG